MPLALPTSRILMSPSVLEISACRPDTDESAMGRSQRSDLPMTNRSCRIGNVFTAPDGFLTMKFAPIPSSSAGSIISVFGLLVSTAIDLFFRDDLRPKVDIQRTREPSWGQGAGGAPVSPCKTV